MSTASEQLHPQAGSTICQLGVKLAAIWAVQEQAAMGKQAAGLCSSAAATQCMHLQPVTHATVAHGTHSSNLPQDLSLA